MSDTSVEEQALERLRRAAIREARLTTSVLGVVFLLGAFLLSLTTYATTAGRRDASVTSLVLVAFAAVMAGLRLWAKWRPVRAMFTAAAIYVGLVAFNTVLDPSSICQGFVIKLMILGVLYRGMKAAMRYRQGVAPARF